VWRKANGAPELDDLAAYWVPDRADLKDDAVLDANDLDDELWPVCGYPYPCHCRDDE